MNDYRNIYAAKALSQVPRLLTQLDRDPYSPTYGSFDRSYWHDKASDFSNADCQQGAHVLALVHQFDFPGNPYKGQPKIKEWAIAALAYWTRLQHRDGSFDEHYPYERGWAGPTAFLVYYAGEAYRLLSSEMSAALRERIAGTIGRAASSIIRGETEKDRLANHHALACLAVSKARELVGGDHLKAGYERLWKRFMTLHDLEEGWSMEYDGADPGYLSATVSFLAKLQGRNPDPTLQDVLRQSIEFCSYFVFPDGSFAGGIGSRNTAHFYPHGFEVMAEKNPLAQAIAKRLARSLEEGKLIPPEIMSDRYMALRMSEYLLAYLACSPRAMEPAPLPCEREPFVRTFAHARMTITNQKDFYMAANLGKGGAIRVFHKPSGRLLLGDDGIRAQLSDGRLATSQWLSPAHTIEQKDADWEVRGQMQKPPRQNPFSVLTNILFRTTLLAFGWCPWFSHWLKGKIRGTLMLRSKPAPLRFKRTWTASVLTDEILLEGKATVAALSLGDGFLVRHVPQSLYFQNNELSVQPRVLSAQELETLNREKRVAVERRLNVDAP